jgi:hypothetical protein
MMKKYFLVVVMVLVSVSAFAQTSGGLCEVWDGRTLIDPSQLAVNPNLLGVATSMEILTNGFVATTNKTGPFVRRCTAKLVIPTTGPYRFGITANKLATLWVSPTTNISRITPSCRVSASFSTPTVTEFDKNLEQKSSLVTRTAGATYYITVIQVATSGTNHLAAGWQLSTQTFEQPIPNSQLQQPTSPLISVLLSTDKSTMVQGAATRLTWSTNATLCTASSMPEYQYWTGAKTTSGSQYVTPLVNTTLTITCMGSAGSGTATLSVVVTPAEMLISGSSILTVAFEADTYATDEGYVLEFYLVGAAAPFQSMDLGKPDAAFPPTVSVNLGELPDGGLISWPLPVCQFYIKVTAWQGFLSATSLPSPTYAVVR